MFTQPLRDPAQPTIDGGALDGDNEDDMPNPPVQTYPFAQTDVDSIVANIKANPSLMSEIQTGGATALNVLAKVAPVANVAAPGVGSALGIASQFLSALLSGLQTN